MKSIFKLFGMAIAIFILAANSQAKEWRGIIPLKSTRADVEHMLGKPNELGRYQFENERVSFYYTTGPCDRVSDCSCLVPKDTVLFIYVTPEVEMKFSKLKLDRKKYKKSRDRHLLTVVSYANDEEGITYIVQDDEVIDITYSPSAKDCKELIRSSKNDTTLRLTTHSTRAEIELISFARLNDWLDVSRRVNSGVRRFAFPKNLNSDSMTILCCLTTINIMKAQRPERFLAG